MQQTLTRTVFAWSKDSNPAAYGLRCFLVVSSDDNHTNTGRGALLDRLAYLGAGRVQHPHHTHKRHVTLVGREERSDVETPPQWPIQSYLILHKVLSIL